MRSVIQFNGVDFGVDFGDFGDSPLWYEVKNPAVAEKN